MKPMTQSQFVAALRDSRYEFAECVIHSSAFMLKCGGGYALRHAVGSLLPLPITYCTTYRDEDVHASGSIVTFAEPDGQSFDMCECELKVMRTDGTGLLNKAELMDKIFQHAPQICSPFFSPSEEIKLTISV